MRSYSVAVASLAIDAPQKWTDNAISQHRIEGIVAERRGVARRISFPALLTLAVARELVNQLHLSLTRALEIAAGLAGAGGEEGVRLGPVALLVDLDTIRRRLHERLGDALESAPSPIRGRPRRSTRD